MAISIKKYVDIKSGINNIKTATEKDLIARIFTKNLKEDEVIEFDNSNDVRERFGDDSAEYKIAQKYFAFINKYSRSPKKISFYWDWRDGEASSIRGEDNADLEALKLITAGAMKITIGEISEELTSIDLSSATSLDDVAGTIETAIRGANEDETFTNAKVYVIRGMVFIQVGTVGNINISVEALNDSSLVEDLGLSQSDVYMGHNTGSIQDVFDRSYQISNNFATFAFIDDLAEDEGTVVHADVGEAKALGIHINEKYPSEFMFVIPVLEENKETIQTELSNINGVSLELCNHSGEAPFNFVLPMAITATTDYNKENGTVNYMYTQDNNMAVVVDSDDEAESNDELKINYYGRTQQAGQKLAFYQNGVLQGNYQDQSIYVNEIWLKDALTTKYLNYMLLTPNWYANKGGQAIGQSLAMDVIERAKFNGTITTEKEISEEDKVYIYNITANENTWRQIYQEGYYLATNIEKKTINNQETYVFNYLLLYSKGDSIKKVEGLDILI